MIGIKKYLNLTAGILVRDYYPEAQIIRIQSSHVESKSYDYLFYTLSDDLLYNLATGNFCEIIDCSIKYYGKIERIAIPIIIYVLNRVWFSKKVSGGIIGKDFLEKVYKSLSKRTKQKLKYYRKFLKENKKVRLYGRTYLIRKGI